MYNAFISYSHVADGKLAPALQAALEKFAKPWYKVRYLNIFRDETSLTASPHLWSNIQSALSQSEYLIYLASPTSAASKWINKEIEYWLEHKSVDTILIGLTDGEIWWDDQSRSFMNVDINSLPEILEKKLIYEPFYVDLRNAKTQEDLSLNNPIFKKDVLKLAAQLRLTVIPVIDENENYVGSVTRDNLLNFLASETDIIEPGGILVLDLNLNDYSLSEISRIIEMAGAKVLSAFTKTNADTNKIELTLKINQTQLQQVMAALNRYNYVVKESFVEPEYFEDLQQRYEGLMNYLNI